MKKYYLGLLLLIPLAVGLKKAQAGVEPGFPTQWEIIQISSSASPANLLTPQQIPLTPSGGSNVGFRPCLTELSWSGDNFPATGMVISVLDGVTTGYQLAVTTFTSGAYMESWPPQFPLCMSANTTGYIQISTGNFKVNATGFRRTY